MRIIIITILQISFPALSFILRRTRAIADDSFLRFKRTFIFAQVNQPTTTIHR